MSVWTMSASKRDTEVVALTDISYLDSWQVANDPKQTPKDTSGPILHLSQIHKNHIGRNFDSRQKASNIKGS